MCCITYLLRILSSCTYCMKAWISSTFPLKNKQLISSSTPKLVRKRSRCWIMFAINEWMNEWMTFLLTCDNEPEVGGKNAVTYCTLDSVVVLEESPCPRGYLRTNLQVLVLALGPQVLDNNTGIRSSTQNVACTLVGPVSTHWNYSVPLF